MRLTACLLSGAILAGCAAGPSIDPETGLTYDQQAEIVRGCVRAQGYDGQYSVDTRLTSDATTVRLGESPQMPPQVRAAVEACIATQTAQLSTTGFTGSEPRPITDQSHGGKYDSAGGNAHLALGSDLPHATVGYGCVPGGGTFQRGTLICPGANH